jgi:hypothetical protein
VPSRRPRSGSAARSSLRAPARRRRAPGAALASSSSAAAWPRLAVMTSCWPQGEGDCGSPGRARDWQPRPIARRIWSRARLAGQAPRTGRPAARYDALTGAQPARARRCACPERLRCHEAGRLVKAGRVMCALPNARNGAACAGSRRPCGRRLPSRRGRCVVVPTLAAGRCRQSSARDRAGWPCRSRGRSGFAPSRRSCRSCR